MPIDREDIDRLRVAAASSAGPLAEALLGARNQRASTKTRWHFGRNQGSLWVNLAGPRAGTWRDESNGAGGDMIALVQHAKGMKFLEAVDWLRNWLGIPPGERPPSRPAPQADPPTARRPDVDMQRMADALWNEARPAAGTAAEGYLRWRGLLLPENAPFRFHGRAPLKRDGCLLRIPALLARMSDPLTGEPRGVVRIFVHPEGHGKAEGNLGKPMLGPAGVVRLVPDEDVCGTLGVAEGIETALGVMQMGGWSPVWACVTAGGIARFPVLAGIECLTVFADPGKAGEDAGAACASRWADAGREARVLTAPPDTGDWLDLLTREGAL